MARKYEIDATTDIAAHMSQVADIAPMSKNFDIVDKLKGWGGRITVQQDLLQDATDEIEWLRTHIRALIENDPNDDAADAVTVLDIWRKQALEHFGEWPTPGVADNPFLRNRIDEAVAAEREACAVISNQAAEKIGEPAVGRLIADAILKRG